MDLVDVHRRLLSGADPCRASVARAVRDGLTLDALRPRSDAGRGRRSGGEEDADRPRVIRWGIDCWGSCYEGSDRPTTSSQTGAWEKDAAWPRVNNVSGKAARREAASLLSTADRRMSKWRPGCVSAMPQSMRSLSKRQTHFDRLVEDGAQGALRPWCPAAGAINPNSQTDVQRMKRSTPIAGRVSSGRRTNVKLQPPDLDRGRRATSNPPVRSALPAKGLSLRFQQQYPRGRPGESESSSGRTRATGITHPGFYGRKPWKKPNSTLIIDVPRPAKEGLGDPFGKLPPNRSQNFTGNPSHSPSRYRHNRPKVRRRRSSRFLIALRVSKSAV